MRRHLASIFSQVEVYIDGGIRRGTDILKAVCLGAKAVLIGRPFLYSLAYGEDGPKHLVDSELYLCYALYFTWVILMLRSFAS